MKVKFCSEAEFFEHGRQIARGADAELFWQKDEAEAIARRDAGLPAWRVADAELDTCFSALVFLNDDQRSQLHAESDPLMKRYLLRQFADQFIQEN